jgi:hypothetical protein
MGVPSLLCTGTGATPVSGSGFGKLNTDVTRLLSELRLERDEIERDILSLERSVQPIAEPAGFVTPEFGVASGPNARGSAAGTRCT